MIGGCSIIRRSLNGSEGRGGECGAIQWKEAMAKRIRLVMVVSVGELNRRGAQQITTGHGM